jgi:putative ABC transport system permease protein
MSLFTTQAIRRAKEVGMRKIMGAKPQQLMSQFLTEVLLLTFSSVFLAIIFYQVALPFYNSLSGKSLGLWQIFEYDNLIVISLILVGVILISGLYPAFFITRFKAGSFLNDSKLPSSIPNRVRNGLVVFQFVVSVSLIAAAIVVQQQMNLMKNKDLGFEKDQVVNIKLYGYLWWKAFSETDVFKNEFLKNPDIIAVGRTGSLIGERLSMEIVVPEGKDQDKDNIPNVRVLRVDESYLDVMNFQLVDGRNFSKEFNDSTSFIINESAAKVFGLTSPVNEMLDNESRNHRKGKVVGLLKDFHFASLHDEIEPLVIEFEPGATSYLSLKIRAGKTNETLEYIKSTIDKLAPNSLFVYEFLDDRLDALYKSEDNMGKVFQFFSVLAIVIACLGLLGLSAFTIESRTKEIGIRKVLGATVSGIVALVSSKFFRLILIGFVMAVPLTWYFMNEWLSNFAYKVEIEWWVFVLTGLIVVFIAFLTVGFYTIKAAVANPVKSLRYE